MYLRLFDVPRVQVQSRAHFFALAARMMRRLLVDSARARRNGKRGGHVQKVSLDEAAATVVVDDPQSDFVALDEALRRITWRSSAPVTWWRSTTPSGKGIVELVNGAA